MEIQPAENPSRHAEDGTLRNHLLSRQDAEGNGPSQLDRPPSRGPKGTESVGHENECKQPATDT